MGEILDAPALDEIGRQGPGGAAESQERRVGRQISADQPDRFDDFGRRFRHVGIRQGRHVGGAPDRFRHDRPRGEIELDAQGRKRAHDVGEDDGRIQRKPPDRLQGDLGSEVGAAGQFLEAVLLAELPVFGQVASGLTVDPQRPSCRGLARQCAVQQRAQVCIRLRCRGHDGCDAGSLHEDSGLLRVDPEI